MTIKIAKPEPATDKQKDPNFKAALIVFGTDDGGKPHASSFAEADSELAAKAAGLMGMRTLVVETDEHHEVAKQLPQGRVFASGKAFVPFVRKPLYDRLSALAGPSTANSAAPELPAKPNEAQINRNKPPMTLPTDWSGIVVGAIVLMREGPGHGWFEAEVSEAKGGDLFILRWRDWSELPVEVRKREQIALLHPATTADTSDQAAQ